VLVISAFLDILIKTLLKGLIMVHLMNSFLLRIVYFLILAPIAIVLRLIGYDPLKLLLGNGLLTSEGDFWRKQRRLAQPGFHKEKLAAIGYCFGGTVALELARAKAPLKGVVSFHGGLSTPMKGDSITSKILVLHGGDDPYVPDTEVLEFQKEMRSAKADWQFMSYGNTVHSFTNPEAGNDPSQGAAYNELSAKRSWEEMKIFLKAIL
jgi:hypothetical protein